MDEPLTFPMRINRYLALRGFTTRKGADTLILAGQVFINGERAVLGKKVIATDHVEVRTPQRTKPYRYIAYYKPRGIITHSPQRKEKEIADIFPEKGVFPVGRLDKGSEGLIILTDDGRVTERLLHPRFVHEKEYEVTLQEAVDALVCAKLVQGVHSEGEYLRAVRAHMINHKELHIILTEGKKHQVRRMLSALHYTVKSLKRIRIMDIHIGTIVPGEGRFLMAAERVAFLKALNLS